MVDGRHACLIASRRPTWEVQVTSVRGPREWFRAGSVPIVFLLLAVWISVEALQVPLGTFRMPGAGFFPLALGLILGLLSVLLWGTRILAPVDGSTGAWPERREVLYLIGSVAAAVGLFEHLGFLFTMTLFLALTVRVLGKTNWP